MVNESKNERDEGVWIFNVPDALGDKPSITASPPTPATISGICNVADAATPVNGRSISAARMLILNRIVSFYSSVESLILPLLWRGEEHDLRWCLLYFLLLHPGKQSTVDNSLRKQGFIEPRFGSVRNFVRFLFSVVH